MSGSGNSVEDAKLVQAYADEAKKMGDSTSQDYYYELAAHLFEYAAELYEENNELIDSDKCSLKANNIWPHKRSDERGPRGFAIKNSLLEKNFKNIIFDPKFKHLPLKEKIQQQLVQLVESIYPEKSHTSMGLLYGLEGKPQGSQVTFEKKNHPEKRKPKN